jgi:predicted GTPase
MDRKKVIIMGAAGRDFHNFNTFFRDNPEYDVVAFTAYQIPDIEGRTYPVELAGSLYPSGIPIYAEDEVADLIKKYKIDIVVFSYSDVPHEYVMHRSSMANSLGANFMLLGARDTQVVSTKPVVSICAIRTGSGKSQTSRKVVDYFHTRGYKVVAIRHPMPYGDLRKQIVQRFASYDDFRKHECTIEEREEYEPYTERGMVIYAGVDYEKILRQAEQEADVIIWDGGNNDFSFYKSDLQIVVVDPHRPGHELKYYPGETNFRMADVIVINKMDTATAEGIAIVKKNIQDINPTATVIKADSEISVADASLIRGKKVLVIEDGPTLTHGEMKYGAGIVAAQRNGAAEIIDPRPYAVGSIKATFTKYNHLDNLLPAMGYGDKQMKELEETINATPCDAVVIGTPIDLGRLLKINKPSTRVTYELKEQGAVTLEDVLKPFEAKIKK